MSQSNLSRFYQKRQKRNNELLSGIVFRRSKHVKTKKNSSEATLSATAATSRRMEITEEFYNFEENSRSAPEFEINERRAESPRFEALEPEVVIETRAKLPAATAPRFEIIESAATSPAATSPAATSSTAAAAETTTSRPASKRRRTEVGSVGQHSDGNIRKNVK
jgi:hypothetical protein